MRTWAKQSPIYMGTIAKNILFWQNAREQYKKMILLRGSVSLTNRNSHVRSFHASQNVKEGPQFQYLFPAFLKLIFALLFGNMLQLGV